MKQFKSSLTALSCLCLFSLVIICSACGSANAVVTTPKIKPTPTPTPLPVATPLSNLTTYIGPDFSISHPNGWQIQMQKGTASSLQTVRIIGPGAELDVLTTDSTNDNESTATLDEVIGSEISAVGATLKNSTQTTLTPVTIAGLLWERQTISGDSTSGGYTVNTKFIIAGTRTSNGTFFFLVLQSPTANFDSMDEQYFQPMLASFKFK